MDTSPAPVHLVIFDLTAFRNQLWAFYGRCGTWRAVANLDDFEALRGVSKAPHALLCKLAKETDYYPTDLEICKALNIPAPILVPACTIPGCTEEYIHLHGARPFNPAIEAIYTPATQHPTKNRKPPTPRPHYEFDKVTVARAEMGWAI